MEHLWYDLFVDVAQWWNSNVIVASLCMVAQTANHIWLAICAIKQRLYMVSRMYHQTEALYGKLYVPSSRGFIWSAVCDTK